jgi:hypothetical protein
MKYLALAGLNISAQRMRMAFADQGLLIVWEDRLLRVCLVEVRDDLEGVTRALVLESQRTGMI